MAELLIKAVDAVHDDPTEDRRSAYKRGDVVRVEPDGHPWGRLEGPPQFVRLRIPGAARALAQRLEEEQDDDDTGAPLPEQILGGVEPIAAPRRYRRRRWSVDLDALPPAVRQALAATGEAAITRAQVRTRIARKRDRAAFPDL